MDAGARAASVVAELLAFYGQPALRRPPYLHGESPLPDGTMVLRIALGRFTSEGLEAIAPPEREAARVAALAFVRQVCLWERATHYQVLCLEPAAAPDAIRECYHLLIALIHPDRHDAEWPAGAPQRANQAYAVLADAGQRAEYDRQLLKAYEGVSRHAMHTHAGREGAPSRRRRSRGPGPVLARFAVVTGVVAALFIVQAWWVGGDVAPQHSLLERAIPASERWVRSVLPDAPRFLNPVEIGERLPPLDPPRRIASLGSWVPVPEGAVTAPLPASNDRRVVVGGPESALPAPTAASPPATRVTPPVSVEPQSPPVLVAQAAPPATRTTSSAAGPSRDQVEGLVALLVGYYDAGDADRLTELFDPDKLGLWSGYRTRTAYADFFGATRERRLRMERLDWQTSGAAAQARGEATVIADYQDGRARLERRVPVELDIVLREGKPRLARLVLFPLPQ